MKLGRALLSGLSTPQRILLILLPLSGLFVAAITPPFQAPDEQVHLYRAYQISEGSLLGEIHAGESGAWLPASLPFAAEPFLRIRGRSTRKLAEYPKAALSIPLAREERRFVAFETTTLYSPVPYVPQALGIAVARLFDVGPLPMLYASRIANLVAGTLLLLVALQVTPIFRWVLLLLALMPMSLFQLSSASADAFTNSIAFVFIAWILRLVHEAGPIRRRETMVLFVVALLLSLSKQAYFPLLILALAIPVQRFGSPRAFVLTMLALFSLNAVALGTWAWLVLDVYVPPSWLQGQDPDAQLTALLTRPAWFAQMLFDDLVRSIDHYSLRLVGSLLGSVDVVMPIGFIRAYQVLLVAAAVLDSRREVCVTWRLKLAAAAVAFGDLLLIWTAIYVDGTPVGAAHPWGVQGRYFIPLSPLVLLPFYNVPVLHWIRARTQLQPWLPAARTTCVVVFLLVSSALVCHSLLTRYYAAGALC